MSWLKGSLSCQWCRLRWSESQVYVRGTRSSNSNVGVGQHGQELSGGARGDRVASSHSQREVRALQRGVRGAHHVGEGLSNTSAKWGEKSRRSAEVAR